MTAPTFEPINPPSGRLRVGIIGAGDISKNHLIAWKAANAEVVAVCDTVEERANARAAEYGIPSVYTDAAKMVAEAPIDAVDIATWRDTHGPLVRMSVDAGKAILCQKPLAPTLTEAEELVAFAEGRVRMMVNENRRFAPPFQRIAEWADDNRLGQLRQCHMIMHRAGFLKDETGVRPAVKRAPRMADEPRLLIAETLIHQIDVLRMLLGQLRIIAARTAYTEPDMPGETLATLMMEMAAGAPVILSGSFVAPGFGTAVSDRLEIIGSRSSVILNGTDLESRGAFQARESFDAAAVYQACFNAAAQTFATALLNGTPFPEEARGNLETLRLVENAYQAAASSTLNSHKQEPYP